MILHTCHGILLTHFGILLTHSGILLTHLNINQKTLHLFTNFTKYVKFSFLQLHFKSFYIFITHSSCINNMPVDRVFFTVY